PASHEAPEEGSEGDDGADAPDTPETSDGEDPPADPNEAAGELPSTLDELAEAFGVERGKLLDGIKVTAKIDGEEVEVNLADAIAGYQRGSDYTRKTTELSEQRKAFEQAVTEAEAELRSRAERFSVLTTQVERLLTGAEPNWAELRKDPQKFLLAKHDWD